MTMVPIYTMEEVAAQLRMSRRMLQDIVKEHPFYFSVGNRKRFTEEDIAALIAALRPSPMNTAGDRRTRRKKAKSFQPSDAVTLERALELASQSRRKSTAVRGR